MDKNKKGKNKKNALNNNAKTNEVEKKSNAVRYVMNVLKNNKKTYEIKHNKDTNAVQNVPNVPEKTKKQLKAERKEDIKEGRIILGISYRQLLTKLKQIFVAISAKNALAKWPQRYQDAIKNDTDKWMLSRISLCSMNHNDKEKNIALMQHASMAFLNILNQNWNQDLWVILCENSSELISDDTQYDRIIEAILQAAKNETTCLKKQLDNLLVLVTENPWWNLFKKIKALLSDDFQKCEFTILFFALSEQQKTSLFDILSMNIKDCEQNLVKDLHSHLLMTDERWMNLCQVIELIKQKRGILKMLSSDTLEDIELKEKQQSATTCTVVNQELENEQKPDNLEHNDDLVEDKYNPEKIKNELLESGKADFFFELNLPNTPSLVNVKLEPNIDEIETVKVENDHVNNEQDIKSVSISTEELREVKTEEDSSDVILTEIKQEQLKNEEEEDCIEVSSSSSSSSQDIKEVNREGNSNDSSSNLQENQPKNQQAPKTQNVQAENSSIDKYILQLSFQQINKSKAMTTSEDCINISDDDDDCILNEDNKLEVGQLLNMYRNMVSGGPTLAGDKNCDEKTEVKGNETENFVKIQSTPPVAKVNDNFAVPGGISSTDNERNPSTSSSANSKTSKMNIQMSAQKLSNKIRRNRSKTNASVKKLFEHLRNESQTSCSKEENTVVVLDDTITPKKRKMSPITPNKKSKKGRYFDKAFPNSSTFMAPITIEDSSSVTPKKESSSLESKSSMHCSTPIVNENQPDFIPIRSQTSKANNNNKSIQNFNTEVTDLTKEINRDSYLTIDLTTESLNCSSISKAQTTVIDLDKSVDPECTLVSVNDVNLSISGESDVTVLNMPQSKNEIQMRKFVKGISKLDAAEKGKLLELITQNIFSGCSVLDKKKSSLHNSPHTETSTRATETAEDTYIKEVILGQTSSRNSIGSNIYNPERDSRNKTGLRMIIIDGSNVAMKHGRGKNFSIKGLKICIDYFLKRGHVVKAFVPRFRCKFGYSTDPRLLDDLERDGLVIYTPSREIHGRTITSYDDRYIVQCAAEFDGVIVSGDNYRDLLAENPRWRFVIENRLLMFTWVNDMIMFPKDPLGRNGPTLEHFLRHQNPLQPRHKGQNPTQLGQQNIPQGQSQRFQNPPGQSQRSQKPSEKGQIFQNLPPQGQNPPPQGQTGDNPIPIPWAPWFEDLDSFPRH